MPYPENTPTPDDLPGLSPQEIAGLPVELLARPGAPQTDAGGLGCRLSVVHSKTQFGWLGRSGFKVYSPDLMTGRIW